MPFDAAEIERLETLGLLQWYFQAKELSLRNVMALRAPLSAEQANVLRLGTSQYFVALLSAIDGLLESTIGTGFKDFLVPRLRLNTAPDGTANLQYLRELRNALVHRNLDIAARVTFVEGIPVLHSPAVTNRARTMTHVSPLKTVPELIAWCEESVCPTLVEFLDSKGCLVPSSMPTEWRIKEMLAMIDADPTIPEFAKTMASQGLAQVDFAEVDREQMRAVRKSLAPIDLRAWVSQIT